MYKHKFVNIYIHTYTHRVGGLGGGATGQQAVARARAAGAKRFAEFARRAARPW